MSFYNAFSLPVTIVRPFNTFGPRQSARAIIPTVITQIAAGQRVIKVGDLTPTRDFNYVRDTARGFLAIAQADPDKVAGQEINIATQREVSMEQTLRTIASIMGVDVEWVTDPARAASLQERGAQASRQRREAERTYRMETGVYPRTGAGAHHSLVH